MHNPHGGGPVARETSGQCLDLCMGRGHEVLRRRDIRQFDLDAGRLGEDGTTRGELSNLEQIREWFGRPLWKMDPEDANAYFGRVLREAPLGTRHARVSALCLYFEFLELRHKAELHAITGIIAECPIDEMNRPRGGKDARLRVLPLETEIKTLLAGWAQELGSCRKFAPAARNYAAARLMADVGLRVNEARHLDLADVRWELGRFGKLHVRVGKGTRGSGPGSGWCPC